MFFTACDLFYGFDFLVVLSREQCMNVIYDVLWYGPVLLVSGLSSAAKVKCTVESSVFLMCGIVFNIRRPVGPVCRLLAASMVCYVRHVWTFSALATWGGSGHVLHPY